MNFKVGDKVINSDKAIFEITAFDDVDDKNWACGKLLSQPNGDNYIGMLGETFSIYLPLMQSERKKCHPLTSIFKDDAKSLR